VVRGGTRVGRERERLILESEILGAPLSAEGTRSAGSDTHSLQGVEWK